LSPEVVKNAAREVQTGNRVSLNWGLEKIHHPGFGRTPLKHKFVDWRKKEDFHFFSYDDEITVNTQAGNETSQCSNTEARGSEDNANSEI
jgi:hypothetical protein